MVLRPRGPLVLGEKENRIMNATRVTKATWEQRIRGLVAGTQKHSPNGSLTLGGATYTATALVQLLQSLADALGAVDSAKASWQDALKNATDLSFRSTGAGSSPRTETRPRRLPTTT
jgi:hypothetical protein